MRNDIVFKDSRLLEALDYIDSDLIAGAMEELKLPDIGTPSETKGEAFRKSIKYTLALAACLIVLSLSIPMLSTMIGDLDFFAAWAGNGSDTNGMYDEYILTEEDLAELNEAYFRMNVLEDPTYAEMDEAVLNELREDRRNKFAETVEEAMQRNTHQGSSFYFGKYSDCIVVATNGMLSTGYSFELCGYRFNYSHTMMLVCYDATFYYVTQAYEMGLLTESDIEKLYRTYAEYYLAIPNELKIVPPPAVYTSPVELSNEEKREIVWEYIKDNKDENKLDHSYNIRCYGKFDHAYAVMIGASDWLYTDAIRTETVNGIEFVFPNGQKMCIYYFGEFYSLEEAFERGVIDEDDLMSIVWQKRTSFTYAMKSEPVSVYIPVIRDILRAYVDQYTVLGEKNLDFSLRCYGQFHSDGRHSYVVFIDQTGKTYESKVTREEVNGLIFEYPTEQKLIVYPYDEGAFYSLREAFDAGLLTEEELYEVYLTYTQKQ